MDAEHAHAVERVGVVYRSRGKLYTALDKPVDKTDKIG